MRADRNIFKFKQFDINQTGCAMRINTDGVLIGAIANHLSPKYIFDVGTGTGVIALMMAQRFPEAFIDAVEIDEQAAVAAGKNFHSSVFSNRMSISHMAIEDYSSDKKYDIIVSNPPFFVNDLKNEELRKGIARHADDDFFYLLVGKTSLLLADEGQIWFILPVKQANEVIDIALKYGLSLAERTYVHSDQNKPAFRQIICLKKGEVLLKERVFNIYESLKEHTSEYKTLLKDFFLAY